MEKSLVQMPHTGEGEIVLYQPNDEIRLDVRLENDTVWLSQQQMAELFKATKQNISLHISNIFSEGELFPEATVKEYLTVQKEGKRHVTRLVKYYNLDVIISVGYRIKSIIGTRFRQWANKIIQDYLLKGGVVNDRFERLELRVAKVEDNIDFFVRTSLPPMEQVFYNGEFFTARVALESIIKKATKRVVMIDGYIDAMTFDILDARPKGVSATIYTNGVGDGIKRLIAQHDAQADKEHIEVFKWNQPSHDRWLIVDDILFHCGHSFNATGKTLSAVTQLDLSPDNILHQVN